MQGKVVLKIVQYLPKRNFWTQPLEALDTEGYTDFMRKSLIQIKTLGMERLFPLTFTSIRPLNQSVFKNKTDLNQLLNSMKESSLCQQHSTNTIL